MGCELALGILGMLLILAAFMMEEFERHTRHESLAYNMINLCGAFFLAVYAWSLESWPFLILNIIWMLIAAWKLVEITRKQGRRRKA